MLTAKQEKFARCIVEGMTQADAYRSAYNTKKMSDKTIREAASRLMADSNVSAMVDELRGKVESETIMTAKERLEWLSGIVRDGKVGMQYRLSASDQMNKMQGEYSTTINGNIKVKRLEDLI